jgi:serine/threonine-protein kinase
VVLTGTRLGPYEILAPLGAGGMGEVWKARDTRLDRIVAIKRLVAPHGDRFAQEARAVAALNHPHICQIHDVGPDYLVLEYVEGRTLGEFMALAEPIGSALRTDITIRLAIQIASALEAAHRRGILHRDLKPANIMVAASSDSPSCKLLDFGIAKLVDSDADVTRTIEGTVLGTAAYMSPVQADGRRLDARSDIFSFGAVLYEMAAGSRAFTGATALEVLKAVLRSDPPPLEGESALDRVVRRCLQKDPVHRFQTMADVKASLEQILAKPAGVEALPSIAVLPFADMSAGKDHEWFSDGLSEEIINALAQIPGLKVIARTSAFAFKGQPQDIRRIADVLGVTTVLEGSVRKAGNRIRITAQLIAAADGRRLWSDRFDRDLEDVFAVQDEIARAIASALKVALAAKAGTVARPTPKLPAYESFLRARHYLQQWTPESLTASRKSLEQAIALDPEFAQAYTELAVVYYALVTENQLLPREAVPLIRQAAERASEIDASRPDAQMALGMAAALDYDWDEVKRRFEVVLAHKPVPLMARYWFGFTYLASVGKMQELKHEIALALQDDPLNLLLLGADGMYTLGSGDIVEGETKLRQVLDLESRFWIANLWLGALRVAQQRWPEALALTEKAYGVAPGNYFNIGQLAGILKAMGQSERADALMGKLGDGTMFGGPAGFIAYHLVLGEIDQAADWCEQLIDQRDPRAPWIVPHLFNARLKSSPRWPALARMMNLPS